MEFIPLTSLGRKIWDDFCRKSPTAWFRHTTTWIEYTMNMRAEGTSADYSFSVVDNGELVAIVPLIREAVHGRRDLAEFGFAGWNVPFPAVAGTLGERHHDKIIKAIFVEIDRLAALHNVAYAAFEVHPVHTLLNRKTFSCNPLPFLGYSAAEIATHIVPLDGQEDDLLRGMRKGHKADITASLAGGLTVRIYDSNSISDEVFDAYRRMHFAAAGRQTRSDRTWDLMRQWIRDGFAVLSTVRKREGNSIAAALSLLYKDIAYYGSACIETKHIHDRGVMHVLVWETMKALKSRGARWYETGWQHTPTFSQEIPSLKEVNISLFKRGFGGMNVPYYRGEKFYDRAFMAETFQNRLEKLHGGAAHE